MKRIISAALAAVLAFGGAAAFAAETHDGAELVVNGGFEDGAVSGWSSNYAREFTQADVTADPLGKNGNSLYVTGRWNQWSAAVYKLENKLEGGMSYRVSAEVMYNEKTADDEGNEYEPAESLDFQIRLGTDNDSTSKYLNQSQEVKSGEWTEITAEFTLPYDVPNTLYMYFLSDSGSFPQNRVSFYLDNLSIVETNVTGGADYALRKLNILGYFPNYLAAGGVTLPDEIDGYKLEWRSGRPDVLSVDNYVTSYNPPAEDTAFCLTVSADGAENSYALEAPRREAAPDLSESSTFTSKPALGWNSFDGYTCAVTEDQVLENARFVAGTGDINLADYGHDKTLKDMGYEYIVVDQAWYMNQREGCRYELPMMSIHGRAAYHVNQNGYWVVDERRFPSAMTGVNYSQPETPAEISDEVTIVSDNNGFKPLAAGIHEMGLKFGIHLQRGIPKIAVDNKLPVEGCDGITADMIADTSDLCGWNDMCYGLDMTKPGAQEYLNGEFRRYAEWGVDFVKIDDLSRPYDEDMVEGYRKAIDNCGRPIYFSTSPGATPVDKYGHVSTHANMWRIIDDFWDDWGGESDVDRSNGLNYVINVFQDWDGRRGDYHYPDGDMIPFGQLVHAWAPGYYCNFTEAEKRTTMTVWAMNQSPIMLGGRLRGYLGRSDQTEFKEGTLGYPDKAGYDDLKYVINEDMLKINQDAVNVRLIEKSNDYPIWTSESADGSERYLALVNSADHGTSHTFSVRLKDIDGGHDYTAARNIWTGENVEINDGRITVALDEHDSALLVLSGDAPSGYPYEITELKARSLSGADLTEAPVDEGFIAEVTLKERRGRVAEDQLFVGVYGKDGSLLSLGYIRSDFAENREYSAGIYVPAQSEEIGSIRAYVWSSFSGAEPLAESREISY